MPGAQKAALREERLRRNELSRTLNESPPAREEVPREGILSPRGFGPVGDPEIRPGGRGVEQRSS